jgi:hypothetical protein
MQGTTIEGVKEKISRALTKWFPRSHVSATKAYESWAIELPCRKLLSTILLENRRI